MRLQRRGSPATGSSCDEVGAWHGVNPLLAFYAAGGSSAGRVEGQDTLVSATAQPLGARYRRVLICLNWSTPLFEPMNM